MQLAVVFGTPVPHAFPQDPQLLMSAVTSFTKIWPRSTDDVTTTACVVALCCPFWRTAIVYVPEGTLSIWKAPLGPV
jgi:hypothetical protein